MEQQLKHIASLLKQQNNIGILMHKNPDGDTTGSAFGLQYGLQQLGLNAKIFCSDPMPKKLGFVMEQTEEMKVDFWVSVDVADKTLLGNYEYLADDITICIDHHKLNKMETPYRLIDVKASATCEVVYRLLLEMGVTIDYKMANALYTGICTDSGCFQFSNTSPRTHRIAAELMEAGAEAERINREQFGTKSKNRLLVEREVLEGITFACDNRMAMIAVTCDMVNRIQVLPEELNGIAAIPRQIEGVEVGVLLREREDGAFRVSVRTVQAVDASAVCAKFNGGGHARAAGCVLQGDIETVKQQLIETVSQYF